MSRTYHHKEQKTRHAGDDYSGRYKCNRHYCAAYGVASRDKARSERRQESKKIISQYGGSIMWKTLIYGCLLLLICLCAGCASDHYAGRFEAHMTVDPETHQITGLDVITTKNYGNINASGTIDPKTQMPVFNISAENVDATSLAAIVAKSNADIAKSVSSLAGSAVGIALGSPLVGQ